MGHRYQEIAFTDRVQALQSERGSRAVYAKREDGPPANDRLGAREAEFIAARDSFYMASVSATGWPYMQHRGGPEGFVRILDDRTLGFADFSGNKQYISVGNLIDDDRVALFFMDYANRARLKLYGRAEVIGPDDEARLQELVTPGYRARVERGLLIHVEAFDWNCPQHITRRFTETEVAAALSTLQARIAELEAELAQASGLSLAGEAAHSAPELTPGAA